MFVVIVIIVAIIITVVVIVGLLYIIFSFCCITELCNDLTKLLNTFLVLNNMSTRVDVYQPRK